MARFGFKDIKVYLQKKFLYINCGMVCYLHGSNYDSVFPINTGLKVINIDELYTSQGNSAGDTGSFITFEVNVLDTAFNTYQTNFLLLGVEDITSTVLSIISQLLNQALPEIVQNSVDSLDELKKLTVGDGTQDGLIKQVIDKTNNINDKIESVETELKKATDTNNGYFTTLINNISRGNNIIRDFIISRSATGAYVYYHIPNNISKGKNYGYFQDTTTHSTLTIYALNNNSGKDIKIESLVFTALLNSTGSESKTECLNNIYLSYGSTIYFFVTKYIQYLYLNVCVNCEY